MTSPRAQRNRLPYVASVRNEIFNIRRGESVRNGKPTGEHRSEVHARNPGKTEK